MLPGYRLAAAAVGGRSGVLDGMGQECGREPLPPWAKKTRYTRQTG